MTVTNHFELRWVDGYGAASDAPSELAVLIEELADKLPRSLDRIELAVRNVRLPDGAEARIGVLQLDVVVPSEQRPVAFLHAAVLPPGHRLDAESWRALVARRYGPCPEDRIREIYGELAVTTKDKGRDRLRALEIRPEDVREIVGSRPSSTKLMLKKGGAPREADEPAARPASASLPAPTSAPMPVSLPMPSPPASPAAGAPFIAGPGAMLEARIADRSGRPADDDARGAPDADLAIRAPLGTWPGMRLQAPGKQSEAPSDATTPLGGAVGSGATGARPAAVSPVPETPVQGAAKPAPHRSSSMLGFAAAGVSALVVVAAVGVAIYAWKLAAERDRLEEQLTRPRAEDPALQAARDELHGKQRELELARKRIDELLAGARSDAELQSCRDTLAEARTKLGVAENRASDLSSSVVNYQNQLSTATRTKVDVEARYTSELQIRRSVETERDDLRRTNTKLGDEISRREKHQKLLCDELRSNRVKLPAICKGMP